MRNLQVVKELSKSKICTVSLVRNIWTEEEFVVKHVHLKKGGHFQFPFEISCNKVLQERGVSGINKMLKYDVHSFGEENHYRMLFEKRDFDLFDYSREFSFNEEEAKNIARQILRILTEMMEKAGMTHLDLKPENVLIDVASKQVELCDLAACILTDNKFFTVPFFGTMAFAPPEQLHGIVYPLKSVV